MYTITGKCTPMQCILSIYCTWLTYKYTYRHQNPHLVYSTILSFHVMSCHVNSYHSPPSLASTRYLYMISRTPTPSRSRLEATRPISFCVQYTHSQSIGSANLSKVWLHEVVSSQDLTWQCLFPCHRSSPPKIACLLACKYSRVCTTPHHTHKYTQHTHPSTM